MAITTKYKINFDKLSSCAHGMLDDDSCSPLKWKDANGLQAVYATVYCGKYISLYIDEEAIHNYYTEVILEKRYNVPFEDIPDDVDICFYDGGFLWIDNGLDYGYGKECRETVKIFGEHVKQYLIDKGLFIEGESTITFLESTEEYVKF